MAHWVLEGRGEAEGVRESEGVGDWEGQLVEVGVRLGVGEVEAVAVMVTLGSEVGEKVTVGVLEGLPLPTPLPELPRVRAGVPVTVAPPWGGEGVDRPVGVPLPDTVVEGVVDPVPLDDPL